MNWNDKIGSANIHFVELCEALEAITQIRCFFEYITGVEHCFYRAMLTELNVFFAAMKNGQHINRVTRFPSNNTSWRALMTPNIKCG